LKDQVQGSAFRKIAGTCGPVSGGLRIQAGWQVYDSSAVLNSKFPLSGCRGNWRELLIRRTRDALPLDERGGYADAWWCGLRYRPWSGPGAVRRMVRATGCRLCLCDWRQRRLCETIMLNSRW